METTDRFDAFHRQHPVLGSMLVALCFILAMLLLTSSLVSFMVEVRVSLRAVHIRDELLERDKK